MFRLRLTALLFVLVGSSTSLRADTVYLAVGDSSAFGETDRTRNPSNGDRGYVAPFANFLGTRLGTRPTVVNTALNGETTTSYTSGLIADRASTDGILLNSRYASFAPNFPSQLQLVRQSLAAVSTRGGQVGFVTLQLGANDLSNTAEAPGFLSLPPAQQQQRVVDTINLAAQQYAGILGELRTRLPNADIYTIGYHNPYGGSPSHPFFGLAAPAVQGLNQAVADVSQLFGAKFVNFYPIVAGREKDLTLIDLFPRDLINYVHLNDAGYAAVSQELIRVAATSPGPLNPVPAPPAVVLFALAVVGLRAVRRSVR